MDSHITAWPKDKGPDAEMPPSSFSVEAARTDKKQYKNKQRKKIAMFFFIFYSKIRQTVVIYLKIYKILPFH